MRNSTITVLLMSLILITLAKAQTKVTIHPLDFQDEGIPETLIQSIFQLETMQGSRILIRTKNAHIIEIDARGRFLGKIGPIDFGSPQYQNITAFAVAGNHLVTLNPKLDGFVFHHNRFVSYFQGRTHARKGFLPSDANRFGFDGARVVIPAPPGADHLADVFRLDGQFEGAIGKADAFPKELVWSTPMTSATLWDWDGSFWYALSTYKPVLRKFDRDFNLIGHFGISGDEVARCEERLYDTPDRFRLKPPHFSDMKVFRGHIYMMCLNALYQIDAATGELVQRYYFFGRGEDFSLVPEGQPLALPNFTFLEDGTLVLSHPAMLWNHDLWLARLDGIQKTAKKEGRIRGSLNNLK